MMGCNDGPPVVSENKANSHADDSSRSATVSLHCDDWARILNNDEQNDRQNVFEMNYDSKT
jgi:hypothetical protein